MRTEVRRGRKFIEYIDDSLPAGTFVQEISGADVSYQDEQGVWLPADENWATDGLDGYIVKADKLNHKVRLKGTGGRVWYPRRNVASEYLTFGIPQYWSRNKWGNFGFSGWSVDGKTITLETKQNVTIKIHSRWNGIKIDWILNNANAPVRMRYAVALTGITESGGVLHGADSVELGRLTPTTATDANGLELPCTGAYAGGYVEFSADVTGAVYPVTVDPDFASGANDGYIYSRDTTYATAHATSYGFTYNNVPTFIVGQTIDSFSRYLQYRGVLYFDTSAIGVGSTVNQVNLKLTPTGYTSGVDFDVQIVKYDWSELAGDPTNATYRETAYDGILSGTADDNIWRNTDGISTNTTYTSGNLSTDWVSKTGITYYGLRSSRDVSESVPLAGEYITIGSATNATSDYRPCLIVVYSAGGQTLTLTCAAGSYSLTGSAATLTVQRNYVLSCGAGSYSITGTDIGMFILSPTPECRVHTIEHENRTLEVKC